MARKPITRKRIDNAVTKAVLGHFFGEVGTTRDLEELGRLVAAELLGKEDR